MHEINEMIESLNKYSGRHKKEQNENLRNKIMIIKIVLIKKS